MSYKSTRKIKNYLVNKPFQVNFLKRFFLYTFLILTISWGFQYFIILKPVYNFVFKIQTDVMEQIHNLSTIPQIENDEKLDQSTKLLEEQKLFLNKIDRKLDYFASSYFTDYWSKQWLIFLAIIFLINATLSLIYGLIVSHNFAGNNYRLLLFAKQIQKKNISEPLVVRKNDFFEETAQEFELARKNLNNDFKILKEDEKTKNSDVVQKYVV